MAIFNHNWQTNPMECFDFHCHTTVSDGSLTPEQLLDLAIENGVTHLSITDHDTVAAYHQIDSLPTGIKLIPGIEFSTHWNKRNIHVVGLNLDIQNPQLLEGIALQSRARQQRAELIAEKLQKKGLDCAIEDVSRLANGTQIGRPHFAQRLVETGAVKDMNQAFKKYLGAGKPGDVKQFWADMPQVIDWIHQAGGIAVLAHPLKYKLTRSRLQALVEYFSESGGDAMEIQSGAQLPHETRDMLKVADQFGLLTSFGSDFHHPGQTWSQLGAVKPATHPRPTVLDRF